MIPIVEAGRHHRDKRLENAAADSIRLQLLAISYGKQRNASKIVIHHPHIQSGSCFFLENFQHTVPHNAGAYDKVFQKDIFLCLPHFLQHGRKCLIPQWKILRGSVIVNGTSCDLLDIRRLHCRTLALQLQFFHNLRILRQVPAQALLDGVHLFPLPSGQAVAAQKQVEQSAKHREQQDRHQPCNLISRIGVLANDK